ncbi:nitrogen regulation protein NR(II) [Microbulbifer thermotolerans]|uniref:Sensory histidine kinase/phosphatase NtrB n=1 Tax=Microbulbifer thermotolerans TaxID=252514 RepID=A0A143HQ05_MICTH|nr:nitrogen regulation protein NR(II) [Microbulbifer thermotolerans]AMX03768.1 PAS domain-containing sensor histidine kinase [Microbulbifer thermotolerans]MCX2780710.1 nitrogen regulation protein NR(II) [Microbulbifer thermotolerans]MCX2783564.1 nitrogen regulation protein NR(II) [Microbulbifer thermotolerans]MCX2795775.1 nitrogen regulation protein NR(II) [Microbulbifer thermotolerans]MCX2801939.1 nitrogen regulation protein NR(II) [Microbulbifer thermotolerans]
MLNDRQFRQLLDSLNSAVLVLDDHLQLRYLNSAAEDLLAASSARIGGVPLAEVVWESQTAEEAMRNALESGEKYTVRRAVWRLHNLETCTVDYTVCPVPELGLLLEVQPMDRLLRIAREDALISAQETTRNLVRGMAHEVKNPLGGIRGAAQLLQRELADEELTEYTRIIIEEADRLRNLVDRLLGPRVPVRLTPTNVHEILERVAQLIDAECDGELKIRRDYDPSIPDVPADREQLIQALLNIARNAMQALDESIGLAAGQITLRTRIQRQFTIGRRQCPLVCRIEIEDNGPGIPEDIRERIFYPMISGRAEGSGLGLSISQNIINQHRGLIQCDSRPGQSVFQIFLPLMNE